MKINFLERKRRALIHASCKVKEISQINKDTVQNIVHMEIKKIHTARHLNKRKKLTKTRQ